MKIRNGFISNSSSSSFVIIYSNISQNNLHNINYDNENNIYAISKEYLNDDGYDYFKINQEMFDFLNSNNLLNNFKIVKVYFESDDDNESKLNIVKLNNIEDDIFIQNLDVSNHSSYNIEQLEYNYE